MVALLIIQSVVQGITEFLPVSSSGHLVLIWSVAAWMGVDTSFSNAEMLTLNVALHVGTLFAVIIYFWRLVWAAALGGVDMLRWRDTDNRRLFVFLVIASFPLMVAGLLVAMFVPDLWLLNPLVVAGATLIFGLLLLFADIGFDSRRTADDISLLDALVFGLMQCLALIPGTSRSGITLTAGRMLSINRTDAARLSMLLSIPAIAAAGGFEGLQLVAGRRLGLQPPRADRGRAGVLLCHGRDLAVHAVYPGLGPAALRHLPRGARPDDFRLRAGHRRVSNPADLSGRAVSAFRLPRIARRCESARGRTAAPSRSALGRRPAPPARAGCHRRRCPSASA